jgi:hypothetical protein
MNENIDALLSEYRTLVGECMNSKSGTVDWDALERSLCEWGDWTPRAAAELIAMAKQFGGFMLRNAHALALALLIEDGEAGF